MGIFIIRFALSTAHYPLSIIHRLPCPLANVHFSQGQAVVRYYPAEEATKQDYEQRVTIEERWRAKVHSILGVTSTREDVTDSEGVVCPRKIRKKMTAEGCGTLGYSDAKFKTFVQESTEEYLAVEQQRGYTWQDEWQAPSTLFIIRDALFIMQYSLSVLHRRQYALSIDDHKVYSLSVLHYPPRHYP